MPPTSKLVIVITSWLIFFPVFGLVLHHTIETRNFYLLEGKSLIDNVTAVRKVKDVLDCSFLCLDYGPSACLSFNFGKSSENGFHSCELCRSEKYFEPHKIQDTPSYDYYGTTEESLYRIGQCVSSPCRFGGTCTEGSKLGEFSCQCKPAPTVLPYIDNLCNVDQKDIFISSSVKGVFHGKVVVRYNLNFDNAKKFCELLGAKLASYNQLHAAWEAGLQQCSFGWLADSSVFYPMQEAKPGCGNKTGIHGFGPARNKATKYNTWCYK